MKVLVAVENNSGGFDLCQFVSKHKWDPGTHFRFFHVIDLSPFQYSIEVDNVAQMERHLEDRWKELGETFCQFVRARNSTFVADHIIAFGDAASAIIEETRVWKPDLLLTGTHGNPSSGLWWPHSTAMTVMAAVDCEVITLKVPSEKGKVRDFNSIVEAQVKA